MTITPIEYMIMQNNFNRHNMKTSIGKREQNRYQKNMEGKTGETIKCPICGDVFIKKQYAQAFCSKECKGYYWNAAKPDRHKDKNYNHKYN